jgi:hypothetical protein
MCSLARTRWCMQVEVSFEVATLDVLMPLAVVLDGGVTVLQLWHLPGARHQRFHVDGGHSGTFSSGTS